MPTPYTDILTKLGLSDEHSQIYLSLLQNGPQTAVQLAKTTSVKRTYVYRLCEQLIVQGLIRQEIKDRAVKFIAENPDKLLTITEDQKIKADQLAHSLDNILPSLKSLFAATDSRPIISSYEGVSGLKKIYHDLNQTNEDILLFRSFYDDKVDGLDPIIQQQIREQVKRNIHARVISPLESDSIENYFTTEKDNLVDTHITRNQAFLLPAQIIIYGTKVAIISLKEEIICTLIDNQPINDTFRQLFEIMWQSTQIEHDEIISAHQK